LQRERERERERERTDKRSVASSKGVLLVSLGHLTLDPAPTLKPRIAWRKEEPVPSLSEETHHHASLKPMVQNEARAQGTNSLDAQMPTWTV
jgi:hypothetical protein